MESYGFEELSIQEYCNLKIYPQVGIIEREYSLLNEYLNLIGKNNRIINYTNLKKDYFNSINERNNGIGITFARIDQTFDDYSIIYEPVVLSPENDLLDLRYSHKVKMDSKVLYITNEYYYSLFQEEFNDSNGILEYDNLICYCMIVKDAGPDFEKVLNKNLNFFDYYCILDTGSTDGTIDTIKRVFKNKKGVLHQEPFINFRDSRNRCIQLAGNRCKYIVMLDDTYAVTGLRDFLKQVRGDQKSDSFSIIIHSNDSKYFSNRIFESKKNLKYIYTIHEVIEPENNYNICIPGNKAYITDYKSDYMDSRTKNRKLSDLELLFKEYSDNPDDPRALYYIAQTYDCLGNYEKKEEFFLKRINHPNEGFIQEKLDACFELARLYNFVLHKEWNICMKYYLLAYSLDTNRPESLYFIGLHYYLNGEYYSAWEYLTKAYKLGYPETSQYSLKPTITYLYIPRYLTELCYLLNEFSIGIQVCKFYFTNNSINSEFWNLMENFYRIFEQMGNIIKIKQLSSIPENRIIAIHANSPWGEWTGSDILKKGVGGSETWVIETARYLKRILPDYRVIVFCKTQNKEIFEGVEYLPLSDFFTVISENRIDKLIISRYTEYIPIAINSHVNDILVIFHDVIVPQTIIPLNSKIKGFICLTDWHLNQFKLTFPQFSNIGYKLNYGVNEVNKFGNIPSKKVKNSFIYSSFPNRGLGILLKMWSRIKGVFPDSTLNIYSDLQGEWVNQIAKTEMEEIRALIKVINLTCGGINYYSWVSKQELQDAYSKAEYFLYPCKFEETFCLSAMEAAISKTFVISNNLAGLSETIGDRGLIVHGDVNTFKWQNEVLIYLELIMKNGLNKNELIYKNYIHAKECSWENQTKKLIEILN